MGKLLTQHERAQLVVNVNESLTGQAKRLQLKKITQGKTTKKSRMCFTHTAACSRCSVASMSTGFNSLTSHREAQKHGFKSSIQYKSSASLCQLRNDVFKNLLSELSILLKLDQTFPKTPRPIAWIADQAKAVCRMTDCYWVNTEQFSSSSSCNLQSKAFPYSPLLLDPNGNDRISPVQHVVQQKSKEGSSHVAMRPGPKSQSSPSNSHTRATRKDEALKLDASVALVITTAECSSSKQS